MDWKWNNLCCRSRDRSSKGKSKKSRTTSSNSLKKRGGWNYRQNKNKFFLASTLTLPKRGIYSRETIMPLFLKEARATHLEAQKLMLALDSGKSKWCGTMAQEISWRMEVRETLPTKADLHRPDSSIPREQFKLASISKTMG